jgi:hypothetical protein
VRSLVLLAGLAAVPAHADLYRWIDPESGSVKYSSVAPSWYGDGGRGGPAVEVVPSQAPRIPTEKSRDPSVSGLEARWRAFLQAFSTLAASGDLASAGRAIEQQLGAYHALVAELDRLDPAGRGRRQAEEAMILEKLRK